jgi:hypothetical protein
MEWRKKWERTWESALYCSDSCRSRKVKPIDTELEDLLLARLGGVPRGQGVDPAAAARDLALHGGSALAEPARNAARRLVGRGLAEMVQHGVVVDASTAKGPVLLRLPR